MRLVRKLYEADEKLEYLVGLGMERLIEFVIVGQMAIVVGVMANVKRGMGKVGEKNKANTLTY